MSADSELVVLRAAGLSPLRLARPALILSGFLVIFLYTITLWAAPKSLSTLSEMRQMIRAQFSNLLFREGVFNQVDGGLMIYVRERGREGDLRGILIHDGRQNEQRPSTVVARRGTVSATEKGFTIVVEDGTRHEYDPQRQILQRLNFERYTIQLPDRSPISTRWAEPEERTVMQLLNPDSSNNIDAQRRSEFAAELNRRMAAPFLAPSLMLLGLVATLLGLSPRGGHAGILSFVIVSALLIEGGFVVAYNLSAKTLWAIPAMYGLALVPGILALSLLSSGRWLRLSFPMRQKQGQHA